MTNLPHIRLLFSCLAAVSCAALAGAAAGAEPAKLASWELSHYQIHLLAAVDSSPSLGRQFTQDLPGDLTAQAATVMGGAWRLEAGLAPVELRQRLIHALPEVDAQELPAAALLADKVLLLGIRGDENGFQVQARELDVVTGLWNTTITSEVRQAESLPRAALGALLAAFAPLARIEKVENQTAALRLRAGALFRRDGPWPAISPGAVFRPVLVKSDTGGALKAGEAQLIPWTVLTPTAAASAKWEGGLIACRLDSGLEGDVIPTYHPQRQRLALAVAPGKSATRLRLVTQETPPVPLEGYDVAVEKPGAPGDKAQRGEWLGRSDRQGGVMIPLGPQTVRMLLIRHGDELLARLPIIPGLQAEIDLPLVDDRFRLAGEIALNHLEDELLDLAAGREALAARIRSAAKDGEGEMAVKLLDQFQNLQVSDRLAADITKHQQTVAAVEPSARVKLEAKLASLKKLAEQLKTDKPREKLAAELKPAEPVAEPKPPETKAEPKPDAPKPAVPKPPEPKPAEPKPPEPKK